jgi:hypothetical protein
MMDMQGIKKNGFEARKMRSSVWDMQAKSANLQGGYGNLTQLQGC